MKSLEISNKQQLHNRKNLQREKEKRKKKREKDAHLIDSKEREMDEMIARALFCGRICFGESGGRK